MKRIIVTAAAALAGLLASAGVLAQTAPAAAPAGTTGMCKDGSFTSTASKRGACRGHQGVKEWYAAAAAAPAAKAAPAATAPAPAAKPAATAAAPAPAAATTTAPKTAHAARQAAPGGGPGQVWVNTATKVYHCQGDRSYGTTKQGEYMTEAAAKAAGDRPSHGKACAAS